MKTQLSTTECALRGLFDYAGMFPPAEKDPRSALRDDLEYRRSCHMWGLRYLFVDVRALNLLRDESLADMRPLRLSVLAADSDLPAIQEHLDHHLPELRQRFLTSIGSCSFTEPMTDREALGWL